MKKFTHIGQLHQVVRYVEFTNADPDCPERHKIHEPVRYHGAVKLHGTNCGVRCTPEGLQAQSRTRELQAGGEDYKGFAAFVAADSQHAAIREIETRIRSRVDLPDEIPLTLFGEWCGPGVERGMGINQLPDKQWVLFAACVGDGDASYYLPTLPVLDVEFAETRIFTIADGPIWRLMIDFADAADVDRAATFAAAETAKVEAECPWAECFGVSGLGEGIVWLPQGEFWGCTDLYFKTKGDKHSKIRKPKVEVDPAVLEGAKQFAEFAVSPARLEQGLSALEEQGLPRDKKHTGAYLKWITADIMRECALELEASGLDWKQVQSGVSARARGFFLAQT